MVGGRERGPACWIWARWQLAAARGRQPRAGTCLLDLGLVAAGLMGVVLAARRPLWLMWMILLRVTSYDVPAFRTPICRQ